MLQCLFQGVFKCKLQCVCCRVYQQFVVATTYLRLRYSVCCSVCCSVCVAACVAAYVAGCVNGVWLPLHTFVYVTVCVEVCAVTCVLQCLLQCVLQCVFSMIARWHLQMGWLRTVGSIKVYVPFAEYSLSYRSLLQKRPMIVSMLLTDVPHTLF